MDLHSLCIQQYPCQMVLLPLFPLSLLQQRLLCLGSGLVPIVVGPNLSQRCAVRDTIGLTAYIHDLFHIWQRGQALIFSHPLVCLGDFWRWYFLLENWFGQWSQYTSDVSRFLVSDATLSSHGALYLKHFKVLDFQIFLCSLSPQSYSWFNTFGGSMMLLPRSLLWDANHLWWSLVSTALVLDTTTDNFQDLQVMGRGLRTFGSYCMILELQHHSIQNSTYTWFELVLPLLWVNFFATLVGVTLCRLTSSAFTRMWSTSLALCCAMVARLIRGY